MRSEILLQPRELRQAEREAAVVAERAEVAEVVRDALALEQERAQPKRPPRRPCAGRVLERHGVGPGEGDRAVARDAARKARALGKGQGLEALLNPLVHVAESLLEAQHALAHHREPEMPRLDDACMHGPHRHFVHAFALYSHEGVAAVALRGRLRIRSCRAAKRKHIFPPCAVAQPAALVVAGAKAQEIADRALHPRGVREHR